MYNNIFSFFGNVLYGIFISESDFGTFLMALQLDEFCVSDLSYLLNMTRSAISHQLKALKVAKLIKSRKEGKIVYYSLDDDHVREVLEKSFEHVKEK